MTALAAAVAVWCHRKLFGGGCGSLALLMEVFVGGCCGSGMMAWGGWEGVCVGEGSVNSKGGGSVDDAVVEVKINFPKRDTRAFLCLKQYTKVKDHVTIIYICK